MGYMSRTNSNSITSIFVAALNENSLFRRRVLQIFGKKIGKPIDSSVKFYDCTYSPLLYDEMDGKEIDIIVRSPGKHKPEMMIEIKANIREPLQDSQKKKGEYEITARNHHIPLIYIIPKNYCHKSEIPNIAKTITWESILENVENSQVSFNTQISRFVEIEESENCFNDEEKELMQNRKQLLQIFEISNMVLTKIQKVLERNNRKEYSAEQDQWGIGYYYNFKGIWYFLGICPYLASLENGNYFLSMAITEDKKNWRELEDFTPSHIYFDKGYYYLSIFNSKIIVGDKKVLSEIREELFDISISRDNRKKFTPFYSLRGKVGELKFDNLFINDNDKYEINNKCYNQLLKRILR